MGKLINRITGLRLLISSLPGSALRTHAESLDKPRDVNKRSQSNKVAKIRNRYNQVPHLTQDTKALPGKLDIKRNSPSILYLFKGMTEYFPAFYIYWLLFMFIDVPVVELRLFRASVYVQYRALFNLLSFTIFNYTINIY